MNIKQINEMYEEIKSAGFDELIGGKSTNSKVIELFFELEKQSGAAQDVILSAISEKELVRLMLMIQKTTVSAVLMNGRFSILQTDSDGSLQAYTHSVVLAVIGLLMAEEIL